MSDFKVEMIGNSPDDIQKRLSKLGASAQSQANEALVDTAKEIKQEIEETAPVDTGAYQNSWYMVQVAEDEVWILSDTDQAPHAKFVMLPNQKMVNSAQADLPSSGILHNVKGVARNHQKTLNMNMSEKVQQMIQKFRVR